MRILDRYLFTTLLSPLIYCLVAFGMIFIIHDLFDNLEDFIKADTPILEVVNYYLLLQPAVMVYIAPISLMLAVLYSLSQLTKNHEITAMRACGISLFRIVIPFVIVGFMMSVFTSIIHETVGPWAAWKTEQFISGEKHKDSKDVHVTRNFPYKNEESNRDWLFGAFNKQTFDIKEVRVTQQRPDQSDEYKILAESGAWLDGRWWFRDLSIQYYDLQGNPMGPPRYERTREMQDFIEKPKHFLNEIKEPHLLSSLDLRKYINTHKQFSERDLVEVPGGFLSPSRPPLDLPRGDADGNSFRASHRTEGCSDGNCPVDRSILCLLLNLYLRTGTRKATGHTALDGRMDPKHSISYWQHYPHSENALILPISLLQNRSFTLGL